MKDLQRIKANLTKALKIYDLKAVANGTEAFADAQDAIDKFVADVKAEVQKADVIAKKVRGDFEQATNRTEEVRSNTTQATSDIASSDCKWVPDPKCQSKFTYGSETIIDCTERDRYRPWCSHDPVYVGNWSECTYSCAEKPSNASGSGAGTAPPPCDLPFPDDNGTAPDSNATGPAYNVTGQVNNVTDPSTTTAPAAGAITTASTTASTSIAWAGTSEPEPEPESELTPEPKTSSIIKACPPVRSLTPWGRQELSIDGAANVIRTCFWKRDSACKPSFRYQGVTYDDCIQTRRAISSDEKAWCSIDEVYVGRWKTCSYYCEASRVNRTSI
jgi:hypothetical protein